MFLPGPYMLWWPALRASHPLRTPEAEEPLKDVSTISILWVNTTSSCYFSSGVYL